MINSPTSHTITSLTPNHLWNDTEPTATAITLGNGGWTNYDTWKFTCLLFASVDGISKVGYYDGNSTDKAITTGFQPRFLLIKNVTFAYDWVLLDSVRGLTASGNDPRLYINTDAAQSSGANYITALNSTSFTASRPNGSNIVNAENQKYIYYAHA
jgi:hypothetical protein